MLSYALVMAFINPLAGMIAAYFGAWAMSKSGYAVLSSNTLLFWAIFIIILVAVPMVRGHKVRASRSLKAYLAGGCLAFTLVGAVLGEAGMIIGSVIGLFLAAVAYTRTHREGLQEYGRVAVALGAPMMVTMVLVTMTVLALIVKAG